MADASKREESSSQTAENVPKKLESHAASSSLEIEISSEKPSSKKAASSGEKTSGPDVATSQIESSSLETSVPHKATSSETTSDPDVSSSQKTSASLETPTSQAATSSRKASSSRQTASGPETLKSHKALTGWEPPSSKKPRSSPKTSSTHRPVSGPTVMRSGKVPLSAQSPTSRKATTSPKASASQQTFHTSGSKKVASSLKASSNRPGTLGSPKTSTSWDPPSSKKARSSSKVSSIHKPASSGSVAARTGKVPTSLERSSSQTAGSPKASTSRETTSSPLVLSSQKALSGETPGSKKVASSTKAPGASSSWKSSSIKAAASSPKASSGKKIFPCWEPLGSKEAVSSQETASGRETLSSGKAAGSSKPSSSQKVTTSPPHPGASTSTQKAVSKLKLWSSGTTSSHKVAPTPEPYSGKQKTSQPKPSHTEKVSTSAAVSKLKLWSGKKAASSPKTSTGQKIPTSPEPSSSRQGTSSSKVWGYQKAFSKLQLTGKAASSSKGKSASTPEVSSSEKVVTSPDLKLSSSQPAISREASTSKKSVSKLKQWSKLIHGSTSKASSSRKSLSPPKIVTSPIPSSSPSSDIERVSSFESFYIECQDITEVREPFPLTPLHEDVYLRRAVEQGWRTPSAYKLLQIDERFDIFKDVKAAVDLFASPGSWTQVLSRRLRMGEQFSINETAELFFSDLEFYEKLKTNKEPVYDHTKKCDSAVIVAVDFEDGLSLIPNYPGVVKIAGDLSDDANLDNLLHKVVGLFEDKVADLVVCDKLVKDSEVHCMDVILHADHVANILITTCKILRQGGTLVMAIYNENNDNLLRSQLLSIFKQVDIFKPRSSHVSSNETFAICRQYETPNFFKPRSMSRNYVDSCHKHSRDIDNDVINRTFIPFIICGDISVYPLSTEHEKEYKTKVSVPVSLIPSLSKDFLHRRLAVHHIKKCEVELAKKTSETTSWSTSTAGSSISQAAVNFLMPRLPQLTKKKSESTSLSATEAGSSKTQTERSSFMSRAGPFIKEMAFRKRSGTVSCDTSEAGSSKSPRTVSCPASEVSTRIENIETFSERSETVDSDADTAPVRPFRERTIAMSSVKQRIKKEMSVDYRKPHTSLILEENGDIVYDKVLLDFIVRANEIKEYNSEKNEDALLAQAQVGITCTCESTA